MLEFIKHAKSKLTMDAWTIHRNGTNNHPRLGNLYRDKMIGFYFSPTGEDLNSNDIVELAAFIQKENNAANCPSCNTAMTRKTAKSSEYYCPKCFETCPF